MKASWIIEILGEDSEQRHFALEPGEIVAALREFVDARLMRMFVARQPDLAGA